MTVIRSPISPVIFSPSRAPTALYKGGGFTAYVFWMWADGTLSLTGRVQNARAFSTYMWAGGYLNPGGLVDNSETF